MTGLLRSSSACVGGSPAAAAVSSPPAALVSFRRMMAARPCTGHPRARGAALAPSSGGLPSRPMSMGQHMWDSHRRGCTARAGASLVHPKEPSAASTTATPTPQPSGAASSVSSSAGHDASHEAAPAAVASAVAASGAPPGSAAAAPAAPVPGAPLRTRWSERSATSDSSWLRHDPQAPEQGLFRFWHDEKRFKGTGETSLVQRALLAAGGIRTGGNLKAALSKGPLGHERHKDWDLLWSPASTALKAAEAGLRAGAAGRPGQVVCTVPGLNSITKKKLLAETLVNALGTEAAFQVVPRTFQLPAQLLEWKAWMAAHPAAPGGPEDVWILKTAQHLGKGLKIAPAATAVAEALKRSRLAREKKSPSLRPFVVAQQYVARPLLLERGRKWGIRLWVLITRGADPLRAYVHKNGLVLFSNDSYDDSTLSSADGSPSQGHVTNYAQNVDGGVWSLKQLSAAVGKQNFRTLYQRLLQSTAQICAAAMPVMRKETNRLRLPSESTFELLGLDFLVDEDYHPWLLEVNATPSLAVEHADPQVEAMIGREKSGMVADMVALLRVKEGRFRRASADLLARATASTTQRAEALAAAAAEAATTSMDSNETTATVATARGLSTSSSSSSSSSSSRDSRKHTAEPETSPATAAAEAPRLSPAAVGAARREAARADVQMRCPDAFYDPLTLDALVVAELELQCRGRFMPLMELFDVPEVAAASAAEEAEGEEGAEEAGGEGEEGGVSGTRSGLRWGESDVLLRSWLNSRRERNSS